MNGMTEFESNEINKKNKKKIIFFKTTRSFPKN